ncbi:ABC transporter substrate-binding protein [Cellulosilyticum lentocellum]|uniref:ABC-type transporter, periplasmic subunit family 3 n=1 Tax=Cellulosilyticum lentocellum (strain ATCC 49066 / DSM 5427 / NCIMB 11756 / RHM5) TaxID=642492 RepID=F2JSB5_CELLD|nr:ABC transporter substrate-binding protein [Cellulosilyticum lentocellum]ADZ85153.1 ABC-type transporter, periplasmic subunit family 3 [Cellulosilyticum lentocellum DSM 5427]
MLKKILLLGLSLCTMFSFVGCTNSTQTTYEKVKEKKELTFAMTGQYPPFNYIDESGELVGFDIDIANAIADKMGVTAKPETIAWEGIITGLTGKRFDMIIGSMAITEERLEKVSFSNPYYYDGAQLFVMQDSDIADINDLTNAKVGVVTGTTFHSYLSENYPNLEILQFESDVDNLRALKQGRMDALVTGKFVGLSAPSKYGINIKVAGTLLYFEEIGVAIRKEDAELLDAVNTALQDMIDDGTYEEISQKWFSTNILEK